MNGQPPITRFGDFELNLQSRELRKNGIRRRLPRQSFQVLRILLDRPGEVVTREELRKILWPEDTFVDFEHGLNSAVRRLRDALNDSADEPRFVETLPRLGYRYLGPAKICVKQPEEENVAVAVVGPSATQESVAAEFAEYTLESRQPPHRRPIPWLRYRLAGMITAAVVAGAIATFLAFSALSSAPVPRVVGITQVTHSGRVDPWRGMLSDGSRIYFLEQAGDHWNLMQTSIRGGEPQIVATPFRNTLLLDISSERTELLIASFTARGGLMPLWIWPVQGGAPRRVGEVMAYDAVWFPGGRQITYAKDDGVYAVERDGASSRRIVATEGHPSMFTWSRDGRRLRFTVSKENSGYTSAIWEVDADGKHLHRVFPGWHDPPNEWYGTWSADGNYFFFDAWHDGLTNVWAAQERPSWLHRRQGGPVRLTAGPAEFSRPLPAGRRLFVIGSLGKSELVHFDPQSRQSTTLFANIHGWGGATYSRDGQWAVLTGENLRRIKADGTQELALTVPPLQAEWPAWSPDGKLVAFGGRTRGDQLWKLYVTSPDGGTPREIVPSEGEQAHPKWSPDGRLLAFDQEERATSGTSARVSIRVLNIATNHLSSLPDSQGKINPSWSPNGHFLAALSSDEGKLMLFDLRTQRWSQVADGIFIAGTLSWSPDSKFLYFQDLLAPNQPVNRLRMDNRRIELVASFEVFLQGGIPRCGFQGLTPDGALLVALLRNHADIYALDIELP